MQAKVSAHEGKEATGEEMRRIVSDYWSDLGGHLGDSLPQWFDIVRKIPYRDDNDIFQSKAGVHEIVGRPLYLLNPSMFPAIDCKKKTILIAAWAEGNGVKWRPVAVREKGAPTFHHVFPQLLVDGKWRNVDATLPDYKLFEPKRQVIEAEIL